MTAVASSNPQTNKKGTGDSRGERIAWSLLWLLIPLAAAVAVGVCGFFPVNDPTIKAMNLIGMYMYSVEVGLAAANESNKEKFYGFGAATFCAGAFFKLKPNGAFFFPYDWAVFSAVAAFLTAWIIWRLSRYTQETWIQVRTAVRGHRAEMKKIGLGTKRLKKLKEQLKQANKIEEEEAHHQKKMSKLNAQAAKASQQQKQAAATSVPNGGGSTAMQEPNTTPGTAGQGGAPTEKNGRGKIGEKIREKIRQIPWSKILEAIVAFALVLLVIFFYFKIPASFISGNSEGEVNQTEEANLAKEQWIEKWIEKPIAEWHAGIQAMAEEGILGEQIGQGDTPDTGKENQEDTKEDSAKPDVKANFFAYFTSYTMLFFCVVTLIVVVPLTGWNFIYNLLKNWWSPDPDKPGLAGIFETNSITLLLMALSFLFTFQGPTVWMEAGSINSWWKALIALILHIMLVLIAVQLVKRMLNQCLMANSLLRHLIAVIYTQVIWLLFEITSGGLELLLETVDDLVSNLAEMLLPQTEHTELYEKASSAVHELCSRELDEKRTTHVGVRRSRSGHRRGRS